MPTVPVVCLRSVPVVYFHTVPLIHVVAQHSRYHTVPRSRGVHSVPHGYGATTIASYEYNNAEHTRTSWSGCIADFHLI